MSERTTKRYGRLHREDVPELLEHIRLGRESSREEGEPWDDRQVAYDVLWALIDMGYDVVKRDTLDAPDNPASRALLMAFVEALDRSDLYSIATPSNDPGSDPCALVETADTPAEVVGWVLDTMPAVPTPREAYVDDLDLLPDGTEIQIGAETFRAVREHVYDGVRIVDRNVRRWRTIHGKSLTVNDIHALDTPVYILTEGPESR